MSRVTVGKWGKNLAIRVPVEIAALSGLSDGEQVEIEAKDGDLLIRSPVAHDRADAQAAAEELIDESHAYSLGDLTIHGRVNEGRRGC